ncbi:hypothetical protein GW17_00033873 [Ensete ventricosum]|nr:hypothetical protein GW17_00033873 [Ensete ventricosum]
MARPLVGAAGCGQGSLQGLPPAASPQRAATSSRNRSRAWLVPVGVALAGIGSACKGSAHGGAPFGHDASLQGRRLLAQCP